MSGSMVDGERQTSETTEGRLRLYRAVIARALASGMMGTWEWDIRSDRISWRPELYDLFGGTDMPFASTMTGLIDRVVPDDRGAVRDAVRQALGFGEYQIECRILCGDGVVRWFYSSGLVERDAAGRPVTLLGLFADQTEHKLAAEALCDSEERFRVLVEVMAESVWEAGPAGEVYTDSPSWRACTGQTVAGWLEHGWLGAVHPDDLAGAREWWRTTLREGVPARVELRLRRAGGGWGWSLLRAAPLTRADGSVRKWVGMNTDITLRKEAEHDRDELLRRLAEARDAAEQANRAKSEFLANMSHELRTPMTAILGVVELLLRHAEDDRQRHQLGVIKRNGEHLTTILNDVLDLSRIEAGRLELVHDRFSPVSLVEEVRALMEVRAQEKRLPLRVRYEGRLPLRIESDRTRVRQILVNLIGNAVKFTPAGHVLVHVAMQEKAGQPPHLLLRIEDTGVGMQPEQIERLFAAFEQGDSSVQRQFGGSGLGLGISRRLVEMLEGDISVDTAPGRGTIFTVSLPVGDIAGEPWIEPGARPDPDDEVAPVRTFDAHRLDGCRVLVADDQDEVRAILKDVIEGAGGSVEEAGNGLEALTRLQDGDDDDEPIEAVLLDLQMPVLDGYDTVRRLRARGDSRPVVAVTASAMRGDRERALEAGCDDHFAKPIDVDGLVEALGRLCHRHDLVPGARPGERRILIIDDDLDVLELLGEVMEDLGCSVSLAADARSALRALDAGFGPDLALVDLTLPDLSGVELIRTLRAHPKMTGVRLVAVSGHSEPEVIQQVRDAGCDAYYVKPVELPALEREVSGVQSGHVPA